MGSFRASKGYQNSTVSLDLCVMFYMEPEMGVLCLWL